jgi:hypothetical protein
MDSEQSWLRVTIVVDWKLFLSIAVSIALIRSLP